MRTKIKNTSNEPKKTFKVFGSIPGLAGFKVSSGWREAVILGTTKTRKGTVIKARIEYTAANTRLFSGSGTAERRAK